MGNRSLRKHYYIVVMFILFCLIPIFQNCSIGHQFTSSSIGQESTLSNTSASNMLADMKEYDFCYDQQTQKNIAKNETVVSYISQTKNTLEACEDTANKLVSFCDSKTGQLVPTAYLNRSCTVMTTSVVTSPEVINPTPPTLPPTSPPSSTKMTPTHAPYFYTWAFKNNLYPTEFQTLSAAYSKLGLKQATLAFVVSDSGACRSNNVVEPMYADIKEYQKLGGQLILSFGGAAGVYLEDACATDFDLFKIIENLIINTNIRSLDFDIEGTTLAKRDLTDKRARVIKMLQDKYSDLKVSFTLPVEYQSGLNSDSLYLIKSSKSLGVKISIVNLMTMDYFATVNGKTMGDLAIMSADKTIEQLKVLYPELNLEKIKNMIGITPMIGENDDHYIFTLSDATKVTNYAKLNNIGHLAYWAFQRDRSSKSDLSNFSNAQTNNLDFFKIFETIKNP